MYHNAAPPSRPTVWGRGRFPSVAAVALVAVVTGGVAAASALAGAGQNAPATVLPDTSNLVPKAELDALRARLPNRAPRTTDTPRALPSTPPPRNAVVLFDGTSLNGWVRRGSNGQPANWRLENGAMIAGGGDIHTARNFRDFRLHVEFNVPSMPHARGQGRGNSGVYLLGAYEVQVLDSWGPAINPPGRPLQDDECGAIYKVSAPRVNATLPPGVWQTYDIHFRAPRLDASGAIVEPPRVTVFQNGVKIQDNVAVTGPTTSSAGAPRNGEGPILLQDHGNPVRYRNIWLVPR